MGGLAKMHSTAELQRHEPASPPSSLRQMPLPLAEPFDDPSRPARGILVACCLSLAIWLAILALVI
jgi:hypothetical protein